MTPITIVSPPETGVACRERAAFVENGGTLGRPFLEMFPHPPWMKVTREVVYTRSKRTHFAIALQCCVCMHVYSFTYRCISLYNHNDGAGVTSWKARPPVGMESV